MASNWSHLLQIWLCHLVALLGGFVDKNPSFDSAPCHNHAQAFPDVAQASVYLAWHHTTLGRVPLQSFMAKRAEPGTMGTRQQCQVIQTTPGPLPMEEWTLLTHFPAQTPWGLHPWLLRPHPDELVTEDFIDNDKAPIVPTQSWHLTLNWKVVWPGLHKHLLPRKGKETWWLILHQRGPIACTPAYKPTICLGCHATTSTSDHIYLECPHFCKVWLCLLDVLDTLLSLPTPINHDSICQSPLLEFALGFPSLLAGASEAQVIHTSVWVAICFDVIGMAICLLPCCLHHPSTPASLLQACL